MSNNRFLNGYKKGNSLKLITKDVFKKLCQYVRRGRIHLNHVEDSLKQRLLNKL